MSKSCDCNYLDKHDAKAPAFIPSASFKDALNEAIRIRYFLFSFNLS